MNIPKISITLEDDHEQDSNNNNNKKSNTELARIRIGVGKRDSHTSSPVSQASQHSDTNNMMMDQEYTNSNSHHGYSPVMHSQNTSQHQPKLGLNIQVHTESQSTQTSTSRPNGSGDDHIKNKTSITIPEHNEINTSTPSKPAGLKLKMPLNINVSSNAQSIDEKPNEHGTEIVYQNEEDEQDEELRTSDDIDNIQSPGLNNYCGPKTSKKLNLQISTSANNSNNNNGHNSPGHIKMPEPIPIKSSSDNDEEEKKQHKRPKIELNPTTPAIFDNDDDDERGIKIPRIKCDGNEKSPITPQSAEYSHTVSSTKDEGSGLLEKNFI